MGPRVRYDLASYHCATTLSPSKNSKDKHGPIAMYSGPSRFGYWTPQ